jgi:hypothetical protein
MEMTLILASKGSEIIGAIRSLKDANTSLL